MATLMSDIFAGRKFRGFAVFAKKLRLQTFWSKSTYYILNKILKVLQSLVNRRGKTDKIEKVT